MAYASNPTNGIPINQTGLLTINGNNFTGATSVIFYNPQTATIFQTVTSPTIVSNTQITVPVPSSATVQSVVVQVSNGTATSTATPALANFLMYFSVTPNPAPTTGSATYTFSIDPRPLYPTNNFLVAYGRQATFSVNHTGTGQPELDFPTVTGTGPFNYTGGTTQGTLPAGTIFLYSVGGPNFYLSNAITYVAPPTVTATTTNNIIGNDTQLIINGNNFSTTPSQNTVVLSVAGAGFTATVTNATTTQLTVSLTGNGSAGNVMAVVTSNGLSSGAAVQVATISPPVVSSISPSSSGLTPSLPVTITGSGFTGALAVGFGGTSIPSGSFTINSDTSITILAANLPNVLTATGSASGGSATVTVTGPGFVTSTTSTSFTYIGPPTFSITPGSGPVTGGPPTVTATGTNLANTTFKFNGQSATIPGYQFAMRAGPGAAVGSNPTFMAETDVTNAGGGTGTTGGTIDLSQVSGAFPGIPQSLFQSYRQGNNMQYTIPGLVPGSSCMVTLFFSEEYFTTAGSRVFNIIINGTTVQPNFDVVAASGGRYKAIYKQYTVNANSSGQVVITFTDGTADQPQLCGGLMIQGAFTNSVIISPPAITTGGGVYNVVATSTLTNETGSATYSYQPVVSMVTPSSDGLTPASNVTISGYGFTTATAVGIGGGLPPSGSFTIVSDQSITISAANMPNSLTATGSSSGGSVPVTVTAGGVNSVTNGTYAYVGPPTITNISPGVGPQGGGTTVTITGTNFRAITGALFGGLPVTGTITAQSVLAINCGNTGAQGVFVADQLYTNGANGGAQAGATTVIPASVAALFHLGPRLRSSSRSCFPLVTMPPAPLATASTTQFRVW